MLSGFFSMSETSLMAINRYRLKHLEKEGHHGARLTNSLLAETDKLLGVILLCNNFVNASAATLAAIITVQLAGEGELALVIGTLSVTFAILIFSEITPKVIAAAYSEKVGIFCSYALYPLLKVLYPVVWLVNMLVKGMLRIVGIKLNFSGNQAVSMEELRSIVADNGTSMATKNRSILLNLLALEKVTVDDVMTAHTQVETIDLDAPLEDIMNHLASSQHTRLPVREGEKEEIIGILHIRKMITQLRNMNRSTEEDEDEAEEFDKEALRAVITPPYFIPSGTPIYMQIQEFQENNRRIAIIVDEYGEFTGVVTMEDILEELIGDFTTHSPTKYSGYHQEEDGSWIVDGSSTLRDLNKKLKLDLPTDGPKTLNGLVIEHFEDIPESNTSFKINGQVLEILQTQDKVVKSVKILP
jgi:Mg2+/Co2+ transporter CorB